MAYLREQKYFFLTLDFEEDLGSAAAESTFYCHAHSGHFVDYIVKHRLPVTLFVTGEILSQHPHLLDPYLEHRDWFQFGIHAYNHNAVFGRPKARLQNLIAGVEAFTQFFGELPKLYRAPNGMISQKELAYLLELGITGGSNFFPTLFPGRFDFRHVPREAFRIKDSEYVEIPFSVTQRLRIPIALSYHQLLGPALFQLLQIGEKEPQALVFDFHLHDLYPAAWYYRLKTSRFMRLAYARAAGSESAWHIFESIVNVYREKGYEFSHLAAYREKLQTQVLPELAIEDLFK